VKKIPERADVVLAGWAIGIAMLALREFFAPPSLMMMSS
jgi:hypothetical protein